MLFICPLILHQSARLQSNCNSTSRVNFPNYKTLWYLIVCFFADVKLRFKSYQPSLYNLIATNNSSKLCHLTITWSLLRFTRKLFWNLSSSSFVQKHLQCTACYDVSLSFHKINSFLLSRLPTVVATWLYSFQNRDLVCISQNIFRFGQFPSRSQPRVTFVNVLKHKIRSMLR